MRDETAIELRLPAAHQFLSVLSGVIAAIIERIDNLSDRETQTYNMQLAAHEICVNIVTHAYAEDPDNHIDIKFILDSRNIRIEMRDTGQPFNPDSVPEPDLEEVQIHGYGLFLARELMDTVNYHSYPDHNLWILTKNLGTTRCM